MRRSKEEAYETMVSLIQIARRHFSEVGYSDSSLEKMAQEAEMTRGALYHHFRNKQKLFQAVLETVQAEIAECVEKEAATSKDVWEQLLRGCRAFVTSAVEPQNKRILLIDGPAVLGWEEWRMMDERNSMRLLREQLQLMQQQGVMKPNVSVDMMTYALSGAMNEIALGLAQMPDSSGAVEDAMQVLWLLAEGFKR